MHDLAEEEKHCSGCDRDLRPIGNETSERYEYIPASVTVVEEVCLKYACACTVRTAGKPPQPIEKSTAGASLLAQVIVAKTADHLPLHRQEKIFQRHGVDISRKTMGGWLAQCADLLQPLYRSAKEVLFLSKVIGTDDTSVKVLDGKLPFARTGRIWPYYGDKDHPVIAPTPARRTSPQSGFPWLSPARQQTASPSISLGERSYHDWQFYLSAGKAILGLWPLGAISGQLPQPHSPSEPAY